MSRLTSDEWERPGTIKEINNGKIRCITITDISINYTRNIFHDFTGSFYVTAKKGFHL